MKKKEPIQKRKELTQLQFVGRLADVSPSSLMPWINKTIEMYIAGEVNRAALLTSPVEGKPYCLALLAMDDTVFGVFSDEAAELYCELVAQGADEQQAAFVRDEIRKAETLELKTNESRVSHVDWPS